MLMNLLILKHISFEEPGYFTDIFQKFGFNIRICNLFDGENPYEFPCDALLIMGGPMNIYEEEKHPWLRIEKQFLKETISKKIPVIGVCLGAQLIADSLGEKVFKNKHNEIGWFPVKKEISSFMDFLPDFASVFHWHGETFNLPADAIRIFSSEATENQAFLYKDHILALQFHLEMNNEIINSLVNEDENYYDGTAYVMRIKEMISLYDKYRYSNQKMLTNLVSYFLSLNGLLKN